MGMPTEELAGLLKRRLAIIADHAWRDRDPAGHLDALRGASEAIAAWTRAHRAQVDPQLRHGGRPAGRCCREGSRTAQQLPPAEAWAAHPASCEGSKLKMMFRHT